MFEMALTLRIPTCIPMVVSAEFRGPVPLKLLIGTHVDPTGTYGQRYPQAEYLVAWAYR